jgi:hypothetical protein
MLRLALDAVAARIPARRKQLSLAMHTPLTLRSALIVAHARLHAQLALSLRRDRVSFRKSPASSVSLYYLFGT